jgi:hypothetical protein
MISRWVRVGAEEEGAEGEARVPVGVDMMLRGTTEGKMAGESGAGLI